MKRRKLQLTRDTTELEFSLGAIFSEDKGKRGDGGGSGSGGRDIGMFVTLL
jgi:hypothetical protein